MTALEQLIEALEAKKEIAIWADISPLEILDACINEAKELLKTEEEQLIRNNRYGRE